jgi:hypothetical protein
MLRIHSKQICNTRAALKRRVEADTVKFRNIELLGGQVDHLIEKWKIREEFANC